MIREMAILVFSTLFFLIGIIVLYYVIKQTIKDLFEDDYFNF